MVVLIIAVILALVFLTWTLCRAAAVGDAISERLSKSRSPIRFSASGLWLS